MVTIKVGLSRKEGTDNYGSVGACCEVDGIEIPAGSDLAEIARIRDHWLGFCEVTVNDELRRLRGVRAGGPAITNGHHAPAPSPAQASYPERVAPAGTVQARGGRREEEEVEDREDEEEAKPPADGRQLLGWAAKQHPDAKGDVIAFGAQRKFKGKVVDWKQDQVLQAYKHVRGTR